MNPADASLPVRGIVLVEEVNQYGNRVLKPANDLARAVAEIAGTKNLSPTTVRILTRMGFTVSTVGQDPKILNWSAT